MGRHPSAARVGGTKRLAPWPASLLAPLLAPLLALLCTPLAAAQGVRLLPGPRVETQSRGAHAVVAGDLDLDGILDLVALNGLSQLDPQSGYRVFLGLPDGSFQTGVSYHGPYNELFALADFTSDGFPDLVSGDWNEQPSTTLWLFPGDGSGGFGAPIKTPLGSQANTRSLCPADFDGDGHLDLVVQTLGFTWNLRYARGHGDGTFDPLVPLGPDGPGTLVASDIDHDGHLDLIEGYLLRVWRGNGDGSLQPPIVNAPLFSSGPWTIGLSDLDGDGQLDAVCGRNGFITVHRGHGDGTLTQVGEFAMSNWEADQAVVDLDGDGHPDLLGCHAQDFDQTPGLTVCRGLGGFAFGAPTTDATGGSPIDIAIGDFDRDGVPDAALGQFMYSPTNLGLPDLGLVFGQGDGGFAVPARVATPGQPLAVELADLDSDGHLDVVATVAGVAPAVRVALGHGGRGLDPPVGVDVGIGIDSNAGELAVADFDGDGAPDLLVAGDPPSGATVLARGAGDGTSFGPPQVVANGDVADVRAADLDDDGAQDFAVTRTGAGVVTVYFGDGRGAFAAGLYLSAGGHPTDMELADLDGDGRLDIAVADTDDGRVGLLLNLGGRVFAPPRTLAAPGHPLRVAAGDLDRDGRVDLATADRQPKRLSVFLGTGGGAFAPPYTVGLGHLSSSMAIADVNRDGLLDVLDARHAEDEFMGIDENGEPGGVSLLLGRGDGSFAKRRMFFTGANPLDLAVGDLDEDGCPDVAAACNLDASVWLLQNLEGPWEDLGFALASPAGAPHLSGGGVPAGNEHVTLLVTGLPAGAPGLLFVGVDALAQPFKGGTLLPAPGLEFPIVAQLELRGRWPPGIPPGPPCSSRPGSRPDRRARSPRPTRC